MTVIRRDGKPGRASTGYGPTWHNGIHDAPGERPRTQAWPRRGAAQAVAA